MKKNTALDIDTLPKDAELLKRLFERASQVFVKKLGNNDRDWSYDPAKHQGGVYIPYEQRDSGFFPKLKLKDRKDRKDHEIWEAFIPTHWPQFENINTESRLCNYRSKGEETHLTRIPKKAFAELSPASFLVIGDIKSVDEIFFECLTLDSASEAAAFLSDILDIDPDFKIAIYRPEERKASETSLILEFVEEIISAWEGGTIEQFASDNATMPKSSDLAYLARQEYIKKHSLENISPFSIESPGDALREISRKIEWDIFRKLQRRERSIELVRIVMGNTPTKLNASDIIRNLINELPAIDALMLSASQQRKSRAGYSYEHHIETMLNDGKIPYEKQVMLSTKKRPDFILPSLSFIESKKEGYETGFILSAKTTLRERWKQVEREMGGRRLFLTTVDENIAGSVIKDMASINAHLVIPESLKKSKETEYAGHNNVISFREFCDNIVAPSLKLWS